MPNLPADDPLLYTFYFLFFTDGLVREEIFAGEKGYFLRNK